MARFAGSLRFWFWAVVWAPLGCSNNQPNIIGNDDGGVSDARGDAKDSESSTALDGNGDGKTDGGSFDATGSNEAADTPPGPIAQWDFPLLDGGGPDLAQTAGWMNLGSFDAFNGTMMAGADGGLMIIPNATTYAPGSNSFGVQIDLSATGALPTLTTVTFTVQIVNLPTSDTVDGAADSPGLRGFFQDGPQMQSKADTTDWHDAADASTFTTFTYTVNAANVDMTTDLYDFTLELAGGTASSAGNPILYVRQIVFQ